MYIAFLDEFGHVGPFISRKHRQYNHSPVFGMAGYIMPHRNVRRFATWFFQLKKEVLGPEIKASDIHPATWEKKGNDLFKTKNIDAYPELSQAANRIINKIYKLDGRLFFYGREKYMTPEKSNSMGLYTTVLNHSIRQLDRFCVQADEQFMMILDEHESRAELLESAAKTMFGSEPARTLIEPPFQVESHLYQTIQAADWIATLVGRLWAYRVNPQEYGDWEWAEKRFGTRIDGNVTHSTMWRPRGVPAAAAAATEVTTTVVAVTETTVRRRGMFGIEKK